MNVLNCNDYMLNQSCITEINPNSKRTLFWVVRVLLIINLVLACHLVTLLCPHDSMLSKHPSKALPWCPSTCSSADRLAHVLTCWLSHFHSSEAIAQSSLPTCPKILQTSLSTASIWNCTHNPTHETVCCLSLEQKSHRTGIWTVFFPMLSTVSRTAPVTRQAHFIHTGIMNECFMPFTAKTHPTNTSWEPLVLGIHSGSDLIFPLHHGATKSINSQEMVS